MGVVIHIKPDPIGKTIEVVDSGNNGSNQDDNWRLVSESGVLKIQKLIAGAWTTAESYSTE